MNKHTSRNQRFSRAWRRLVIPVLSLALAGCGGGSDDATFVGNAGNGNGNVPQPIQTPTEIGTKVFTIANFPTTAQLTLVSNFQPPTETSSVDAEVLATVEQLGFSGLNRVANRLSGDEQDGEVIPPSCGTADVAALTSVLGESAVRNQSASTVRARYQELPAGAQEDFFLVINFSTITAQKVLAPNETQHCTIFAELDPQGNPSISRDKALAVATAFDSNNPVRTGSGIYDQVRAVFGSEWNQNPPGGADGDTKVVILFFRPETLGNNLFGYTSPADSSPDSGIGNKAEIVYINAGKDQEQTLSTIAHEFQHLINQNEKVIQQGTFPAGAQDENVTVNEGLSGLAEEVCGFTVDTGNTLLLTVINDYLRRPQEHEFFDFFHAGLGYGQGYLFFKYVREQFGDSTIRAISTSPATGLSNLNNQIPVGFSEAFRRWTVANYATNLGGSVPSIYRYPSGFRTKGSTPSGQLVGVKTFAMSNNSTNSSGDLGAWSTTYLTYEGGNGSDLRLTVETAPGSPIGLLYEAVQGTFFSLDQ